MEVITRKDLMMLIDFLEVEKSEKAKLLDFINKNEVEDGLLALGPYMETELEKTENEFSNLKEEDLENEKKLKSEKALNEEGFNKIFGKYYEKKYGDFYKDMEKLDNVEKEATAKTNHIIDWVKRNIGEFNEKVIKAADEHKIKGLRKKING